MRSSAIRLVLLSCTLSRVPEKPTGAVSRRPASGQLTSVGLYADLPVRLD